MAQLVGRRQLDLARADDIHAIAGLAFLEAAGSGLLLLVICWMRGRFPRLDGRHLRFYVITGALGVAIPNFVIFHAARHLSAGLIAILMTLIPLVTYGLSLILRIERFWWVRAVGLLFGLSHGLITSLPVIVAFGCALAWIRSETGSVFPGMFVHPSFNLIALVAAVTVAH